MPALASPLAGLFFCALFKLQSIHLEGHAPHVKPHIRPATAIATGDAIASALRRAEASHRLRARAVNGDPVIVCL